MRILLSAQYPGIPNNHKPIVNEYQIVNGNSYYVTPFEMLAINTQGVRREQCTETAALTHELHPQQKAGVLNPHIKLTFQFRAFQALNSTQERTVSELMLKPNKPTLYNIAKAHHLIVRFRIFLFSMKRYRSKSDGK